jgi:F-type H+-transporting ATPase subunit b
MASGGGSLVDLDGTFFIQLGLFLVTFVFLYAALFRPVIRLIEARREATDGTKARAEAMRLEAIDIADEVHRQVQDIRTSATGERERMVEQARRRERDLMLAAREESRRTIEHARTELEQAGARLRRELEAEVESLAASVGERILGRSV